MRIALFAIAAVLLGLASGSQAQAQRPIRGEGEVLGIDHERMAFLTVFRDHRVIVRAVERTQVFEDGAPASFSDIAIGDHVQFAGHAFRRGDRIVVIARAINIVNAPQLGGDPHPTRIHGRVGAVDCDHRVFVASVRDHRIRIHVPEGAVITRGRDEPIRFCDIQPGDCFVAEGRFVQRGDRRGFVARRVAIVPCTGR